MKTLRIKIKLNIVQPLRQPLPNSNQSLHPNVRIRDIMISLIRSKKTNSSNYHFRKLRKSKVLKRYQPLKEKTKTIYLQNKNLIRYHQKRIAIYQMYHQTVILMINLKRIVSLK